MIENGFKILIVDDEADIIEFLSYNLVKEGFTVFTAANGIQAIKSAAENIPHLILLDMMMPHMDGIETCGELKKNPDLSSTKIAFLTARNEDFSEIAGFDAGADDYITKPIRPKVLMARIHALLKRAAEPAEPEKQDIICFDNVEINKSTRIVTVGGNELSLPKKEFNLLLLLVSKPEVVFTRDDIYDSVWGNDTFVGDRTIDVHIRKLREKIGDKYFETIKGIGYKFTMR